MRDEKRKREEAETSKSESSFTSIFQQDDCYLSSPRTMALMWSHWSADSGATAHMTDQRQAFSDYEPFLSPSSYSVKSKRGAKLFANGQGSVNIFKTVSGVRHKATMKNVLFVPNLGASLISITAAMNNGMPVVFSGEKVISPRLNRIQMTRSRVDKLYLMDIEVCTGYQDVKKETAHLADQKKSTIEIWHQRLAHLNYKTIFPIGCQRKV